MNYTPLAEKYLNPQKNSNRTSQVLFSLVAFFTAVAISGSIYLSYSPSRNQTVETKASEPVAEGCKPGVLRNPTDITATSTDEGKLVTIKKNDTVNISSVTLKWTPIPGAKSYYVLINGDNGIPHPKEDPSLDGKEVTDPMYSVSDLKPNTSYYVYIRSKNASNKFGLSFPSEKDCKSATGVVPVFNFSTAP